MAVLAGKCQKICISDLNKKATIQLREIHPPKMNKTAPTEKFTTVYTAGFMIQTVMGSRRFNGVNINKNTTHIFICRFSPRIENLDGAGEHFINYKGKFYRIGPITNIDEQNKYLMFQATERGLESKEATNA